MVGVREHVRQAGRVRRPRVVRGRYLFVRKTADGVLILLIWVDDIFLGHSVGLASMY